MGMTVKIELDELDEDPRVEVEKTTKGRVAIALTALAVDGVEPFLDYRREVYVSCPVKSRRTNRRWIENYPLDSGLFEGWLLGYYAGLNPGNYLLPNDVDTIRAALRGRALYEQRFETVRVRVGVKKRWITTADGSPRRDYGREADEGHYIDMANEGRYLRVSKHGVEVTDDCNGIRFIRTGDQEPLPSPLEPTKEHPGRIEDWLRIRSREDGLLIKTWAVRNLGDFHEDEEGYPILVLTGREGAAKTTGGTFLKRVVDPQGNDAGKLRTAEDAMIVADKERVVFFDNVSASAVNDDTSDTFCMISTGGSLKKRAHYTNADVHTVSVCRPAIVTALDSPFKKGDVNSRVLHISLNDDVEGRAAFVSSTDVDETWRAKFNEERPYIIWQLAHELSRYLAHPVEKRTRVVQHRLQHFARMGAILYGDEFNVAFIANKQTASVVTREKTPVLGLILDIFRGDVWPEAEKRTSAAILDMLLSHHTRTGPTGRTSVPPELAKATPSSVGTLIGQNKTAFADAGYIVRSTVINGYTNWTWQAVPVGDEKVD